MNEDSPPDGAPAAFLYFAYGSNLDRERLHENCPGAHLVGIARLEGFRLAFTRYTNAVRWGGSGVADILAAPDREVWGAIWEIAAEHSDALDRQEGVFASPPGYRRIEVTVATPAGDVVRCRSYQVIAPDPTGYLPSPEYRATILRGARAVGLPRHYVARLEAIEDNGGSPPP